jgi:MoCo/4Fe-4S cofactor protein with predicted Tat translocation signal
MNQPGKKTQHYWTTLEEYRADPDVARLKGEEFFDKPQRLFDEMEIARTTGQRPDALSEAAGFAELAVLNHGGSSSELSRRDFLKLSAAAAAFATAGCALRPTEKIIPYVKAPADMVPGVANYYATTMLDAAGTGVLVRTREGRPIKIEGNPDHPLSQGKLSAAGQYSLFNLYDPDRLKNPVRIIPGERPKAEAISWQAADAEIGKALAEARGKVVMLTGTRHGPARMKVISDFLSGFGNGEHVMFDAWNYDATRQAQADCYGSSVMPRYRFDRADYFLFLECDPLGSGFANLEWSVDFGKTRQLRDGKMSKVVVFESFLSQTGCNADSRYRLPPGYVTGVAIDIVAGLIQQGHLPPMPPKKDGKSGETMDPAPLRNIYDRHFPEINKFAYDLARVLWEHRGKGLVMGGDSYELQLAVNLINSICENDGRAVDGTMSPSRQARGSLKDMLDLIAEMRAGKVDALIIHDTNPAYWLPESAGFTEALKKVKTVISFSERVDETAIHAHFVLPGLHYLESWGDAEPQAGLYSLAQPCIFPLWDNRAAEDSLISFAKAAQKGTLSKFDGDFAKYLKETWRTEVYSSSRDVTSFEEFWTRTLQEGVLNTVTDTEGEPRPVFPDVARNLHFKTRESELKESQVVIYPSPNVGNGASANNAWLLENPDPVSRISWTNFASMSPKTAEQLGISEGDVVLIEASGNTLEIPAHIQPGDTDNVVSIQAGWGRTHVGKIGNGVGANAFALRKIEDKRFVSTALPCSIKLTGKREKLPCVQGHNYLEGRPIIADTSLKEYQSDPKSGQPHEHPLMSMWPEHEYKGNRWGMTIDLSVCIGCNACIAACQVENNIPVVGREQVERGREMHWIRIDRYYSGKPDEPEVVFQPMLCQHCENAPCETVCPVLATVHNEEGLNQQIYNRCVGTRYCSNNCPYKVRRFNWHEYALTAYDEHPLRLALNPDVTVREKGVMEKCTFCVHRLRSGKLHAKQMGRTVHDEDVVTACQQTCPTNAITFGNMNDPESGVSQARLDERSYRVLEFLNVKPSISYWTKVRNRPPRAGSGHDDGEGHHA